MSYKPGLGQGHNQKKDTHALDFDVILSLGLKQLTSLIFRFAKICLGFPFGQQPVKIWVTRRHTLERKQCWCLANQTGIQKRETNNENGIY